MSATSETRLPEFLPFHRPYMGDEEIAEVVDTLKSGWLTMGPKTQKFEQKFAAAVGADHAVAVSSCTAALHVILASLGIGPGDEVITSPYTFSATVATILFTGATPVLVDTLPDYPNIDPEGVRRAITPRTKAIVPVHFAGAPCDLDRLESLAEGCGAALIEDAAHALPASYKGRVIGSSGSVGGVRHATAFSLYAGKNITTGEGGMITTSDAGLVDSLRRKRLHGISRDAWKRYSAEGTWYYQVEELGFKYNMTDINAAIGLHQLDRLADFHRKRLGLVALYDELLANVPGVIRPRPPADGESSWHLYVIGVDASRVKIDRNEVIDALRADNIGTSVHFIPIHHHSFYQQRLGCKKEEFPHATHLYERSISLPLFPTMQADEVRAVTRSLNRILSGSVR
jgi:dTDP-4-amino-4,6-dideoxygalactose transaminase